jgi:putative PIN family toxin of toxin-antitoxin system
VLRAVLDANVFVSALIRPQGPPGRILVSFLEGRAFELVVSASIFDELRRCLNYPQVRRRIAATDEELDLWVAALDLIVEPTEGAMEVRGVSEDPDDDQYLAAALEGRAQFIVSGDRHLLDLRTYEGVRIVTPREFLRLLEDRP